MPTGLKRDLGLLSTTVLAIGAMVGSGIFILPAIAYAAAGPAAIVAFLLAGLLVLPAAISAAEMATAMPEDGGAYIYVERGMGPVLGTIAGIGTWLMLSMKSSLALVGGVPYLAQIAPVLADWVVVLAVGLALFFTLINLVSAEGAGSLQFVIVGVMLAVMAFFVVGGFSSGTFEAEQTAGRFDLTSEGILAAVGVVFVSYAGVTKVTAVAEEVENPGRNLPLAMIGSLVFTTLLYVGVVWVAIGLANLEPGAGFVPEGPGDETAPIAAAADAAFGPIGVVAIVIAALLALASTANAGLLAASRFPFAMARDGLVPPRFEEVSDRFNTPANAIALTGAVMVALVTVFPIERIAQFGSAFQILVFILLNVALIGFREGAVEEYTPVFVSPLYPWLQLVGIGGGVVVLTQMGLVPFLGSLVIVAGSLGWYYVYARPRTDREGAARTGVRRDIGEAAIERTAALFADGRRYDVLVGLTAGTSERARSDIVRIAADLSRLRTGSVTVAQFADVPHRTFTGNGPTVERKPAPKWLRADDPPTWLAATGWSLDADSETALRERTAPFEYVEITTESVPEAVVEFTTFEGYDLLVLERRREEFHRRFSTGVTDYVLKNAPYGVLLVEDRGFDEVEEIAVVANRGAYDPLKLLVADAIAEETGAELVLLRAPLADAPDARRDVVEEYHSELIRLLTVPARSRVVETDDRVRGLARFAGSADLLVTGAESRGVWGDLFGRPGDRLVDSVDVTTVMVQPADEQRPGIVQRIVLDRLFDR
jgi:amino acid transporter/nucleotide-binding universal stress UspA family protein